MTGKPTETCYLQFLLNNVCPPSFKIEAGHPDATDLTRDCSPGNSDAMDILTLGLGRVLGLELGRQDVSGLKNTGVNFLASGRSRQDVADPLTFFCIICVLRRLYIASCQPLFLNFRPLDARQRRSTTCYHCYVTI